MPWRALLAAKLAVITLTAPMLAMTRAAAPTLDPTIAKVGIACPSFPVLDILLTSWVHTQLTTGMSWSGRRRKVGSIAASFISDWISNYFADDKKRVETGRGHESDDSERPRKKAPAKAKAKAKGKANGKR